MIAPEQPLLDHQGQAVMSASHCVLKGVLECQSNVSRFILSRSDSTRVLADLLDAGSMREAFRRHQLVHHTVEDAGRAATLARWEAREGRRVVALLTGPTVPSSMRALEVAASQPFEDVEALAVVIEDSGVLRDLRRRLTALGLPLIEATGVPHTREAIDQALRLSRAARRPAAIVVERSIMRSMATIELFPNHSGDGPPAGLPRRRASRGDEVAGPLRLARRLELNTSRAMPSPGERASVGFITVGQVDRSIRRLESMLDIVGRMPCLHMGVTWPMDEAAIERLLERCLNVVVLEPHGRLVEMMALGIAQQMGQDDRPWPLIWGSRLPSGERIGGRTHPSELARVLESFLRPLTSGNSLEGQLAERSPSLPWPVTPRTFGAGGQQIELTALLHEAIEGQRDEDEPVTVDESNVDVQPVRWFMDGTWSGPADGRTVTAEVWTEPVFRRSGAAAVRQAAVDGGSWLIVVGAGAKGAGTEVERLVVGMLPSASHAKPRVMRRWLEDAGDIRRLMRDSAHYPGLTVLIVEDGPEAQFDNRVIDRRFHEIDALGYQPMQRLTWPADRACVIRQPVDQMQAELRAVHEAVGATTSVSVDSTPLRWPPRLGARIHPLVEQVVVRRQTAPSRGSSGGDLPAQPNFLHADKPVWCAHLAGVRGDNGGIAAACLTQAAKEMGYHAECAFDPRPIGSGRRQWAQLVFSRPRTPEERRGAPPVIPWGEADVVLGYDLTASLLAIDPDGALQVASGTCTSMAVNIGRFEDELDESDEETDASQRLRQYLEQVGRSDQVIAADLSSACRYHFHNERLADLVLVGMAWQSGWIPLTLDSLQVSLRRLEHEGIARLGEAFDFGRAAALHPELIQSTLPDMSMETPRRSARRYRLILARQRLAGSDRAARFRRLTERVVNEVPGLRETQPGRASHRDMIIALRRCVTWGGFDLAERWADRIIRLYQADRADTGRSLTRSAVLPLAEATLIRDAIYVASMAVSVDHRRQTRKRLNVRLGRGDRLSTRYITRLEFTFVAWRFRLDLRTSDWIAQGLAILRYVMPHGWRGRRRDRRIRGLVEEAVMQATNGGDDQYESNRRVLERLHFLAMEGRLRRMSPDSLAAELQQCRQED